ncbi:SurA N-terminal domain-containing protein [Nitrincola sp. MINF-07-Sa-05]|uniref:SurA N-terminal domain-containing protein n=1 Tax=Nitrincola salilacus TaxID=3400273 RepID=UPI003917F674
MLQKIRDNSKGIIAKGIVGLIALTFALFGVESLIGLGSSERAPAEVNGEDISSQDLMRGIELQRRQILTQMGADADPALLDENRLYRLVLDELIDRTLLEQSADNQGLYLSEEMIDQLIVSTPQFQVNGRFERSQFESILRNSGYTPLMYRDALRIETLLNQERAAYILSAFATPSEVQRVIAMDQQSRDLAYTELSLADVLANLSVDADAVQARYDREAPRLQTEEQVVLEYVLLERDQFVDFEGVSQEQLEAAYDQVLATFGEQEEREAQHILIEIGSERNAAAAQARAQELLDEIRAGADFAEIARESSDDVGSASSGGSLGFNTRGVFADAFDNALFGLEEGAVSEPVRTEFGYHLIRLNAVRRAEPPTFAEQQFELRAEIAEREAELEYVAALEQLADISFSAADLIVPAEELGLDIRTTEPLTREVGEGRVAGDLRVRTAAFSGDLLGERLNSLPIELDTGTAVVVRVKEHLPSRQLTFEEVRDTLEQSLLVEMAQAQLTEQIAQWLEGLRSGEPLDRLAPEQSWSEFTGLQRDARDVPVNVLQKAFSLPYGGNQQKPMYDSVTLSNGNLAIVRLDAVHAGESDLSDEEIRMMASMLASRLGEMDYQSRFNSLRDSATIERR